MEERLIRAVVALGVPGVALIVFYLLLRSFGFTFSAIDPLASAGIAALLLLIVGGITFYVLHRWAPQHPKQRLDDVLGWYENLRAGLGSPKQNVDQIQRIANSNDPNNKRYLQEFGNNTTISFLELDSAREALSTLDKGERVEALFEGTSSKERDKIIAMIPTTDDPLYKPIMTVLKYWRYVNRKNHPSYDSVNVLLANALAGQKFSPDDKKLAQRIVAEERERNG